MNGKWTTTNHVPPRRNTKSIRADKRPVPPEKQPLPNGKKHKKEKLKKHFSIRILISLAFLLIIFLEFLRLCDISYFVDTFYEVEDEAIKNHIRIVLLTDLHLHEFGDHNQPLVEEIQRLQPDLIAMSGDMVDMNKTDYSVVTKLCQDLIDVAPIYFGYGNHEKEVIRVNQTSTINVDLEQMGVHVLHNRYETIQVNDNWIDIGGLSANPGTMDADYTQKFWQSYLQTQNYRLLLVHYPQFFFTDGELLGQGIDMALCGHLHGGQIVVPYLGGLYHPLDGFFPEMTDGCHSIGDTWVIISRGLGNGKALPRINNPPELVIIDLY